ncbi:MAG: hypothetical protein IKW81_06300 [Pseudobutyrivibrio sp.]|nr:hypothetical protein [Pseudobutyrivibrio sp.]
MKNVKLLRGVATIAMAITLFMTARVDAFAMSDVAQQHARQLTADEIGVIASIFDDQWYAKNYPDVPKVYGYERAALLNHFVTFGIWEQRQPAVDFNVDVYATRNPDLHYQYGDDIVAYYMFYSYFPAERQKRTFPTLADAYRNNTDVYSVYDFVKGQYGPRKGAVPVSTRNYHPDLIINEGGAPKTEAEYYASLSFEEKRRLFNN